MPNKQRLYKVFFDCHHCLCVSWATSGDGRRKAGVYCSKVKFNFRFKIRDIRNKDVICDVHGFKFTRGKQYQLSESLVEIHVGGVVFDIAESHRLDSLCKALVGIKLRVFGAQALPDILRTHGLININILQLL